jgi:DNA-binding IscR family transcriptional regulator
MTVGEILRVLEGPVSLVDCTADAYVHGTCDREAVCMSGSLWQRIKVTVEAILDATTLYDLMYDPGFAPGMPQLPAGLERLPVTAAAIPAPSGMRSSS